MRVPLFLVIAPVFIMVLALPLILNKVPKNGFYGFRTPKTLSGTDEQWYQVNHEAGIGMFIAGSVSLLACVIVPFFEHDLGKVIQICSFVLVASVLIATGIELVQHWK